MVILTTRAEGDAVKAAMEMDADGFLVSPIALDKLIGAVTAALSRTWDLQQPSHYASVRGIVPRPVPLEKVVVTKIPVKKVELRRTGQALPSPFLAKAYGRRSETTQADLTRASLKNVRMCILDDVSPGVVLARDLRDREGRVLAPSGTELKPAVLERLKNVGYALADSYCVWVGEP